MTCRQFLVEMFGHVFVMSILLFVYTWLFVPDVELYYRQLNTQLSQSARERCKLEYNIGHRHGMIDGIWRFTRCERIQRKCNQIKWENLEGYDYANTPNIDHGLVPNAVTKANAFCRYYDNECYQFNHNFTELNSLMDELQEDLWKNANKTTEKDIDYIIKNQDDVDD